MKDIPSFAYHGMMQQHFVTGFRVRATKNTHYRARRSGNMPAAREQIQHIAGGMIQIAGGVGAMLQINPQRQKIQIGNILIGMMGIFIHLRRRLLKEIILVYTTCTEMSGSGVWTGMEAVITKIQAEAIRRDRRKGIMFHTQ
jgi:hypothetical protein